VNLFQILDDGIGKLAQDEKGSFLYGSVKSTPSFARKYSGEFFQFCHQDEIGKLFSIEYLFGECDKNVGIVTILIAFFAIKIRKSIVHSKLQKSQ
jgi:hypothetical protein